MTAKSENLFPTIHDLREALSSLIDRGLGDLAVQIVVAPDSTIQSLARAFDPGYRGKPALMIDLTRGTDGRLPVAIISADRLGDKSGVTTATH